MPSDVTIAALTAEAARLRAVMLDVADYLRGIYGAHNDIWTLVERLESAANEGT